MKLTPEVRTQILALHARKWPAKRIAVKMAVSDTSVYTVIHPIKADKRPRQTPAEYRDSAAKQAIRLLSSEIQELRDNVMKRKRVIVRKQAELVAMGDKIDKLVRQRAKLWKQHKGVTQP